MKTALSLFFLSFALYLHTAGPGLVPFRDAGEMATTVYSLGILHPPGYPSYTLIGHLFDQVPLGNPAYRLNVFSGLMLSFTWVVFYLFMRGWFGPRRRRTGTGLWRGLCGSCRLSYLGKCGEYN